MIILVVEDTPQNLYLLEQLLNGVAHTVWSAGNGEEALAVCAKRGVPDLIISDALMPKMDGFELCYRVRRDPALVNVPFVLYTATYTAESDERFALSVGVDRFVIKPVEPEQLLRIIDEVGRQTHESRAARREERELKPVFFEEYARRISLKLEEKLSELARSHELLASSEKEVRELNVRLMANVQQLQLEVSERKRAEELLRMAFQVARMGSWEMLSKTGEIIFSSEALAIMGQEGAEARALELLVGSLDETQRALARNFFQHSAGALELRVKTLAIHGKPRHFLLRKTRIREDAKLPVALLGTIQDVTEETEAELQRQSLEQRLFRAQKMEALGNLAGGIAHDFNNILTSIFGNAELLGLELGNKPGLEEARNCLSEIHLAAVKSRETVQQILTFSRRENIATCPLAFDSAIRDGLRLVRSVIHKGIALNVELNTDRMVMANVTQLHQVLLNLCTNAAYATKGRDGCITIQSYPLDIAENGPSPRPDGVGGPHVVLRVSDNGCGIPKETLEHIFEPFYTTKPAGDGTGLGLSVVHGIVHNHGGSIAVESTPGLGSAFTLYFPALQSAKPQPLAQGGATLETPRHVLVVDDEPSTAYVGMTILTRQGYRVTVSTDPLEARTLFLRNPSGFDVAVIDNLMPKLTGVDLARALRNARPSFPIVMVASFGSAPDLGRLLGQGAVEVITKPFSESSLQEALGKVLVGK